MRKEYERLCALYGTDYNLPLYKEGSVYNFYLKATDMQVHQLAPIVGEVREIPKDKSDGQRDAECPNKGHPAKE